MNVKLTLYMFYDESSHENTWPRRFFVPVLDLPHRYWGQGNFEATDWGKIFGRIGDERKAGDVQRSRSWSNPVLCLGVGTWAGIIE